MNYETCVGILCFSEANRVAGDGRYNKILNDAKKFLTAMQYGADPSDDPNSKDFGGAGYAGKGRPDLSNTAYLLEALHSLETSPNDPAIHVLSPLSRDARIYKANITHRPLQQR